MQCISRDRNISAAISAKRGDTFCMERTKLFRRLTATYLIDEKSGEVIIGDLNASGGPQCDQNL